MRSRLTEINCNFEKGSVQNDIHLADIEDFEKSAITSIMKSNSDITILYDKNWKQLWEKRFKNPLSDAETLKLDKNNKILEIGKKTQNYYNIEAQLWVYLKQSQMVGKNF